MPQRLYTEPDLRAGMVQRARNFLQVHSWEREFGGYLQLLGRLTGTSSSPPAS